MVDWKTEYIELDKKVEEIEESKKVILAQYELLLKTVRSLTYPKTITERQAILSKKINELKKNRASKEEIEILAKEYRLLDVLYEV